MLRKTHITVGAAAGGLYAVATGEPLLLVAAGICGGALGGAISDVDSDSSPTHGLAVKAVSAGMVLAAAAAVLEQRYGVTISGYLKSQDRLLEILLGVILFSAICLYGINTPHRSFMHSFVACILLRCTVQLILPSAAMAFTVGFLSHLALDVITKQGIQLLWPMDKRFRLGLCKAGNSAVNGFLCYGSILVAVGCIAARILKL
ncbi:MAG: metal-dependent hydrolase [Lachnospiraceae bacterium]|nr:metal-dependent hydrolase [Lachnospiraceae bacterium]